MTDRARDASIPWDETATIPFDFPMAAMDAFYAPSSWTVKIPANGTAIEVAIADRSCLDCHQ